MLSGLLSFDLEELHARLALEAPQPTVPSMAVGNFALPSVVGELKQAMQAAFRAKFVVTGVAAAKFCLDRQNDATKSKVTTPTRAVRTHADAAFGQIDTHDPSGTVSCATQECQ